MASPKYSERVFAVVKRIPKGKVASYGDVAKLAGFPRTARFVAGVLRLGHGLPWWRVLGADGSIRIMNPELRREQVDRLEAEGTRVDASGKVDYEARVWRPTTRSPARPGRAPARGARPGKRGPSR